MTARFKTIYADPPWTEVGGGQIVRGAQRHYPVMGLAPDVILTKKEKQRASQKT